jgi:PRTRC genetic system protein C
MALQTQSLERAFRYNSVDLLDPGAQYTPEQVRDFYAPTYPEITSAAIEGPEERDGKLVYTFRRAVGTKGSLLHGQSEEAAALLEVLGAPKHVTAMHLWVEADALAEVSLRYHPERQSIAIARTAWARFHLVNKASGAGLIAAERTRQVTQEGWSAEHDDEHDDHSLALAACAYAAPEPLHVYRNPPDLFVDCWPRAWKSGHDKRKRDGEGAPASAKQYTTAERIRNLAKAGALIAAEIDRLTRLQDDEARQKLAKAGL